MRGDRTDICLITMPYANPASPSASLGILQAILEEEGLSVESIYANVLFANRISPRFCTDLWYPSMRDTLPNWTFAHIAFPDYQPSVDGFITALWKSSPVYKLVDASHLKTRILEIREAASDFIEELTKDILDRNPRIVGCTSSLSQNVPTLAVLKRIKEADPGIVTIIGGSNCETIMGRTTHKCFPEADYVVSGEAEELIVDLTHNMLAHGPDIPANELPVGVFGPVHRKVGYPTVSRSDVDDAPRAYVTSLAGLPIPNYDAYFETLENCPQVSKVVVPQLLIQNSRGCWKGYRKRCSFCGINGKGLRFRTRPADEILNELEALSRRYGIRDFCILDAIMDMDHLKTVIPELAKQGSPYRLFYETPSSLSKQQVKALADAGVTWIQPGIESLSGEILELINKGCQVWQNIQILKWSRQFGLGMLWNLLYSMPGVKDEWYGDMAEIIPALTHLWAPVLQAIKYVRYSVYHERPQDFGLELQPEDTQHYIFPWSEEDLINNSRPFVNAADRIPQNPLVALLSIDHPGLTALMEETRKWIILFREGEKPYLGIVDESDPLIIHDTRPAAVKPEHALEGLDRQILLDSDDAPRLTELSDKYLADGVSKADLLKSVDKLVRNKLALRIDGRLVGLVLHGSLPELPSLFDFAGNGVVDKDYNSFLGSPLLGTGKENSAQTTQRL